MNRLTTNQPRRQHTDRATDKRTRVPRALLSFAGRRALGEFAAGNLLLAFDYDGTLADITEHPGHAIMLPHTRELLATVARHWPALVLTGRSRADVMRLIGTVDGLEVVGNHGIETGRAADPAPDADELVATWKTRLAEELAPLGGIEIEDKRHSLAVHYRRATDAVQAERSVRQAASRLPGARLVGGKRVLNVVPQLAPNKGAALLAEMERIGAPRALFVGDDVTDEDVFALDCPERVLTVRVGCEADSRATYCLRRRDEVDTLLARLCALRAAAD